MPQLSKIGSTSVSGFGKGIKFPPSPTGTLRVKVIATNTLANAVPTDINNYATPKYPGLTVNFSVDTSAGSASAWSDLSIANYDCLFIFSDGALTWGSAGDTFASNGGGLVTAQFYGSSGLTGVTNGLFPTEVKSGGQGGALTWPTNPGIHPIAVGTGRSSQTVKSYNSLQYSSTNPTISSGASVVVYDSSNTQPFVVVKTSGNSRSVYLNMYPPSNTARSDFWSISTYPDGALLMLNALLWAAKRLN